VTCDTFKELSHISSYLLFPLAVGGSVDRACKLEALLRLLSTRRRELRSEQARIDNQFIALMNELQVSLMSDEDLTVIVGDAFRKGFKMKNPEMKAEVRDSEPSRQFQPPMFREERSRSVDNTPLKPRPMERPRTPPADFGRGFFCSSSDVFDTMLPMSVGLTSSSTPPALPGTESPPTSARSYWNPTAGIPLEQALFPSASHPSPNHPTPNHPTPNHPSPSVLKAGALAWREMHGRPASVEAGINFRTGMSGHMALLSTSAHPHDYLNPSRAAPAFLGMSNHTGLNMWKPPWKPARRIIAPNSTSLAMPSFGSPQRATGDESSNAGSTTPTDND
jgi:hypothetical protein